MEKILLKFVLALAFIGAIIISSCEDMLYTWYLSGKKGGDSCPFVLDIGNGKLVEPILKEKD